MKKQLMKTLFGVLMTVALSTTTIMTEDCKVSVLASTTNEYKVGCWVLKEGESVPENLEDIPSKSWIWAGWGSVNENQECVNGDKIEKSICSLADDYLKYIVPCGKTIKWIAERKNGSYYHIYGRFVDLATPTPKPIVYQGQEYKVGYWLLKDEKQFPESFDDFSNCNWQWIGWGKALNEIETINEEVVSKSIVTVANELKYYVGKQDNVKWIAERKRGSYYQIYGCVDNSNTLEEEVVSDANYTVAYSAVRSAVQLTVCPTVRPTAQPTVRPTAQPTVRPTAQPTTCPTTDYTNKENAFYWVMKQGQKCPETLDEINSVSWSFGGTGSVYCGEKVYGEDIAKERIVSVGLEAMNMLQSDEDIRWFAVARKGAFAAVYGEIYNKNVENSIKEGVVCSSQKRVTVDTVEDLKKTNVVYDVGAVIQTRGYKTVGDGGAAAYEVAFRSNGKKYSTLTTATGQHVNLVIESKKINLRQLGAGYCDEIIYNSTNNELNDDADRLNEAIELIDNLDGGVIELPKGEYRCASKVKFIGDNYSIKGYNCKAVIYTDNGYQGDEHFLTVGGNNISFDGIRVEARETWSVGYYRQMSIMFASDIAVTNCEFIVRDNVIAYKGNADKQYTNITLYTGWKNVVIDNCLLEQMGCVERGACVGILDMWSAGCSNAKVTNCIMKQNAHDEMLGIFTKKGAQAGIENVTISNNKMYAYSAANVTPKTMAITVGYDDSRAIDDVHISNNYIEAEVPSNFMTFGNVTNTYVENNKIKVVHTGNSISGAIFDTRKGVTVQNNEVNISSLVSGKGITNIFKRYGTFIDNKVTCDSYVYNVMYEGGKAYNNELIINGETRVVAVDPEVFSGNVVICNQKVMNFISYTNLTADSDIIGNIFNYNYDDSKTAVNVLWDGAFVYAAFHAKINNYVITVKKNEINTVLGASTKNKSLLTYGVYENQCQSFIFEDNKVGIYRWFRSVYTQPLDGVYTEGNTDINGCVIDKTSNYVKAVDNVE